MWQYKEVLLGICISKKELKFLVEIPSITTETEFRFDTERIWSFCMEVDPKVTLPQRFSWNQNEYIMKWKVLR